MKNRTASRWSYDFWAKFLRVVSPRVNYQTVQNHRLTRSRRLYLLCLAAWKFDYQSPSENHCMLYTLYFPWRLMGNSDITHRPGRRWRAKLALSVTSQLFCLGPRPTQAWAARHSRPVFGHPSVQCLLTTCFSHRFFFYNLLRMSILKILTAHILEAVI